MTGMASVNAVFDARWLMPTPSGITVYSRELMRRLPLLEPKWRWHFVFQNAAQRDAALAACALPASLHVAAHIVKSDPRSVRSQFAMPRVLRSLECSIFHSPNYMVPFFAFAGVNSLLGFALPSDRHCGKCIATIHDAIPLVVKDYAPRSATSRMRWLYRASLRSAVRSAARIITVSEASRTDIVNALKLDEREAASIRTIYNGVSERYAPPDEAAAKQQQAACSQKLQKPLSPGGRAVPQAKIVLYVGRLDPYKNVPMLVDAFALLRKATKTPVHLLIVGPEDGRYPEARLHSQYRGIQEHVSFIHGASDDELLSAYRNATMLVNPSRYEGFGLPMVEAMKCGVPVICTDGGSQPEIAGGAAEIVAAGDEGALVEAMRRLLQDEARRRELIDLGFKRSADFSWDRTSAQTLALYREALDE